MALAALEGDGGGGGSGSGGGSAHQSSGRAHSSGDSGAANGAANGVKAAAGGDENPDDESRVQELTGRAYVSARVSQLAAANRPAVRGALEAALGPDRVKGGEGAIYFFAQLPEEFELRDEDVVRWLVKRAGVCVVPGSACQAPGWLRVGFANLTPAKCGDAAARLRDGLRELVQRGLAALDEDL
ncbi:hypothetical protein MNEG_10239 [Monoraphidium neglectum]|uniref:Aminotransferase class I/classII large domain-containing protein n=1 Tax=Monoraphidium neglectum TaxID=145388 RepID=A0A0D2M9S4_9CHLO|nr:hypothetical protein MNEG_10239 [Monoraphidium neglectum]KIY97721.1 hypothetical protein MNEG_10239 [Monoraphidium neglectum]|eukprot:XP_013896741.1 hypothetical protein MNEG_10239 [Monoraphidium neglectum]